MNDNEKINEQKEKIKTRKIKTKIIIEVFIILIETRVIDVPFINEKTIILKAS